MLEERGEGVGARVADAENTDETAQGQGRDPTRPQQLVFSSPSLLSEFDKTAGDLWQLFFNMKHFRAVFLMVASILMI